MDETSVIRAAEAAIKELLGRVPPLVDVLFLPLSERPWKQGTGFDEWAVHFSREKPGMDPSTFLVVINDQTGEARVESTL